MEQEIINAYKSGDMDACLALSEAMLETAPANIISLQHAARLYSNRGERDKAKPLWNRLTEVAPKIPEPHLQSARIARIAADWDSCSVHAKNFLKSNPDHPEALRIQVECYIELKNAMNLGVAFRNLSRINPEGLVPIARHAVQMGMGREVATSLREVADSGDEVMMQLCASLAQQERDAAIAYEIRKNTASAADCYQVMRIYNPASSYPTTSLSRLRKPFLTRARKAYKAEDFQRALEHANTCINIEPQEAEAYIIAARSAGLLKEYKEAFNYLHQKAQFFWSDSWYLLNYARAATRAGKSETAYTAFSDLANRDDDIASRHADEIKTQLERLPSRVNSEIQACLDVGDLAGASEKYSQAREAGITDPKFIEMRDRIRNRGQTQLRDLYDSGDGGTLPLAKMLIDLDPDAPYSYRVAGRILLNAGSFAEALYYWEQLAKMDRENPEFLLNVARTYQRLRNKDDARKAALALLDCDPENAEGKQILDFAS